MLKPQASFALVGALSVAACADPPLDIERQIPARGSLGEEVFRLFHRDFQRDTPAQAVGFELEHDPFVAAVDHLFPEADLSKRQGFLVELLPNYDDDTIPALTQQVAGVADRLGKNESVVQALTVALNREGYVSPAHTSALERRLSAYPGFHNLVDRSLDFALARDGYDLDGEQTDEEAPVTVLIEALAKEMRETQTDNDPQRTIILLADLLLSEDPRLASMAEDATAAPRTVARDRRGMAKVALIDAQVPAPFSDFSPADGLADIDRHGRFIDIAGAPLSLEPFGESGTRDGLYRAMSADSRLLFDYVELDRTILAALLRDGRQLIELDIPMKGVRTAEVLLGRRTRDGHFSATDNAVLDLAYAATRAADPGDLPQFAEMLRILLERHDATAAFNLHELDHQLDIADGYDVELAPGNTLFKDLINLLRRVLDVPGLAEDLVDIIIADDGILSFPTASALLSAHKEPFITHDDYEARRVFATRVDRSQPDAGDNQSLHQRVLHLIRDTRGASYTPRLIGIPLGFIFEIDDLAEMYMLSIIGETEIPGLVSTLTGLPERPTPLDLAIFINEDQTFGNPTGREGFDVKDNDGDALFAVSASGMDEALRPLVTVFHRHDRMDLLFDALELLYLHWPSPDSDYQNTRPSAPRFAHLSGISRYEPLFEDIYTNAEVTRAARNLLIETNGLQLSNGKAMKTVLLDFARNFLRVDPELRTRGGKREIWLDEKRETAFSPFDMLRAALQKVDREIDIRPDTRREFDEVKSALFDTLLRTEISAPEQARFKNTRALPVATAFVRFLEDRAKQHAVDRTLEEWVKNDILHDLEELVESDVLPSGLDIINAMDADRELNELIEGLRAELLDEDKGFPDTLAVLGGLLGAAKDGTTAVPLINFLGAELDPSDRLLFNIVASTRKMVDADMDRQMLEVLRRGFELSPFGKLHIEGIGAAIRQVNRVDPTDESPLKVADLEKIIRDVADYMVDGEHGLEKFYELVENRN